MTYTPYFLFANLDVEKCCREAHQTKKKKERRKKEGKNKDRRLCVRAAPLSAVVVDCGENNLAGSLLLDFVIAMV